MSELRHQAETVWALSRRLFTLAEVGAWPEFAETERSRAEALDQLFRLDLSDPEDRRFLAETVENVLALDARSLVFLEQERDRAAGQLRKLQLGQQGRNAYLTVRDESP